MRVWVDASTLIALDAIGEVEVLRSLQGRLYITEAVAGEVFNGRESETLRRARGTWIEVVRIRGSARRWRSLGLGIGEASLFLTPREDRLVLDEAPARTIAEAEGRDYVGVLGLILDGVQARLLSPAHARDLVRRLLRVGFRVSTDLYDEFLQALEEPG